MNRKHVLMPIEREKEERKETLNERESLVYMWREK